MPTEPSLLARSRLAVDFVVIFSTEGPVGKNFPINLQLSGETPEKFPDKFLGASQTPTLGKSFTRGLLPIYHSIHGTFFPSCLLRTSLDPLQHSSIAHD